jgi:hypothetical protein
MLPISLNCSKSSSLSVQQENLLVAAWSSATCYSAYVWIRTKNGKFLKEHTLDLVETFFLNLPNLSTQLIFRVLLLLGWTSFFLSHATLGKSYSCRTSWALCELLAIFEDALIFPSSFLGRLSSALSTNKRHSGKPARVYTKFRHLCEKPITTSNFGYSTMLLPWLSCMIPQRASLVHHFKIYIVSVTTWYSSSQELTKHDNTVCQFL